MPTCPQCLGAFDEGTPVCPNDGATLLGHDPAATLPVATASALALAARRDDTTDPLVGSTLAGRYVVRRRIGHGGMGVVYEATHAVIGRSVAVKVLHERYLDRPEVAARLMNEARLASSILNEHIVDIFDFGETSDGRTFVVMELLDGESLAQLLRREGTLPEKRVLGICLQVADALGAAHERGIIHRDVKPENVFVLTRDGADFAKVLDFGISKAMRAPDGGDEPVRLTHTGMVLGTPLYMSPEQARGEEAIDHRIDVYALGVILYEVLSGGVPFRGNNYLGIIADVISRAPLPLRQARPDLRISASVEQVVERAMAKDRAERYASMAELATDLRRAMAGEAVAQLPSLAAAAERALRKRRWLYAGIAAITLAVVAITVTMALKMGGTAPRVQSATVVAPPPPAPAPSPPPNEPIPTVRVGLRSIPLGAEVWDGSRLLCANTPCEKELRSDRPTKLLFKFGGHVDTPYDVVAPHDNDSIEVKLAELEPAAATSKPAAKPDHRRDRGSRREARKRAAPDKPPVDKLPKRP